MKHLVKSLILIAVTAYIAYRLIPTVDFGNDPQNILFFIAGLWLISQIINPLFSLVLLPANILTFGLVSFILNIALIFGLINFLPNFSISAYDFPGANIKGFIIPAVNLTQIATIITFSLIISVIYKILHLIFD